MFKDFCDYLFKSLFINVFFKTMLVYLVLGCILEFAPDLILKLVYGNYWLFLKLRLSLSIFLNY